MDAGAAPAPPVGPPRHRPGPPALHHPPTAPTRPTGSAHVSNSSCYSTCSGFHLLKISSIVTSASFYLAFTDQWFNPSPPPYFHYSSILGRLCFCTGVVVSYFFTALARFQGRGSSEVLLCEFVPLCRIGRRLPCQEGILQTPPNLTSIELQHHLVQRSAEDSSVVGATYEGRRGRGGATGPEEGVPGGRVARVLGGFGAPSKESNLIRTACFCFGCERPEIVRYLSRWDIQVALRSGCLVIYRKVINSRKRLRAHVGLDEGEVCPK
uniref:Uncharacterized protein n=1 Tax=Aegilops tauschii TaxID=37682 RepID=N1QU84_AEGTA